MVAVPFLSSLQRLSLRIILQSMVAVPFLSSLLSLQHLLPLILLVLLLLVLLLLVLSLLVLSVLQRLFLKLSLPLSLHLDYYYYYLSEVWLRFLPHHRQTLIG